MPGLTDLRPDFNKLSPEEKVEFIRSYRKRRAEDMEKPATYGTAAAKRNAGVSKLTQLGLSVEQIQLCKTLGLKPKDIMALKEQVNANTEN